MLVLLPNRLELFVVLGMVLKLGLELLLGAG